jgi:hypothetical protein
MTQSSFLYSHLIHNQRLHEIKFLKIIFKELFLFFD